jgi:hypothetical protein
MAWKVGTTSNANGTLSTTLSVNMSNNGATVLSMGCQRALTVRNNVAIDVSGCRKDPGDLGLKAAGQIAAKVDKQ